MSFLSDLFEGNFGNLGTDISHAPESAVTDYRSEWVPALAAGGALLTGGLLAPEILGAGAAGELGAEAGLSAAEGEFGAFSPELFAANEAAAGILPEGVDLGTAAATGGAADLFAGDVGADVGAGAVADTSGGVVDASQGFASLAGDPNVDATALGFQPVDSAGNLTQDVGVAASPAEAAANAVSDVTAPAAAGDTGGYAQESAALSGASPGTGVGTQAAAAAPKGIGAQIADYFTGPGAVGHDLSLALGAAPLALALGMGQQKLPPAGQQASALGTQLSQQGQADLTQAKAGVLNPGQQAYLDSMRQDLTNQWKQTLFNMGVTDPNKDTRWPQIKGLIDQKVTAQSAAFIQMNMNQALAETGQAATLLTSVSQQETQAQTAFTQNLVNASTALAKAIPTGPQKVQIVNA